jgi:hypothetical protein
MSKSNRPIVIRTFKIPPHPFKNIHKIAIWIAAPVPETRVRESLAVASAPGDIRRDHNVALLGKHRWTPAGAPGVFPSCVRAAVDEVGYGILFRLVERAGLDGPRMDVLCDGWI